MIVLPFWTTYNIQKKHSTKILNTFIDRISTLILKVPSIHNQLASDLVLLAVFQTGLESILGYLFYVDMI